MVKVVKDLAEYMLYVTKLKFDAISLPACTLGIIYNMK